MSRITRIVAFALGLAGGVVASQGPEFAQQYRQRLGGGIEELRQVVERFEVDARTSGETAESAIARLQGNVDALASRQGVAMRSARERLDRLQAHRQAMIEAGPFRRIGLLARDGDRAMIEGAYRDFEPAVPVTQEGLLSAGVGFAMVWGGILLAGRLFCNVLRRRRSRTVVA